MKDNNYMMYAEDISKELGIIVISGRVPRAFWETKFYGNRIQIETVK